MAKRTRRTGKPAGKPSEGEHRRLSRHAGVWLATLSTVVGVATGMFTLRDQVFPREAGTAVAVSVPAYQQQVGRVCDEVNDNDRKRARADKTIKRQLRRAKSTISQRNALLDGVRQTTTRAGHTLASFTALEPPPTLTATRRDTEAAWNRNLARLRDYALELDRAGSRKQVVAAIDHLATLRPALALDGDRVRSGLRRAGAANCDLEPPVVTRTYTLPPLPVDKPSADTPRAGDAPTTGPETSDTNDPSPTAESAGGGTTPPPTGGATPPPPPGGADPPPSPGGSSGANTPPVTGGGED